MSLRDTLDHAKKMRKTFDAFDKGVEVIEEAIRLESQINGKTKQVSALKGQVTKAENDIADLKDAHAAEEKAFQERMEKARKAEAERYATARREQRETIDELNREKEAAESRWSATIEGLQSQASNLRGEVRQLEGRKATLEGEIEGLKKKIEKV